MDNLHDMQFRRLFSVNFNKNLTLKLAAMTFCKDFIHDKRGDPYPLLASEGDHAEAVCAGRYIHTAGRTERLLCGHFPYATYALTIDSLDGTCGFAFITPLGRCEILLRSDGGRLTVLADGEEIPTVHTFAPGMRFLVTARKHNFEIYLDAGHMPELVADIACARLEGIHFEAQFKRSHAAVVCIGGVTLTAAESYMDAGLSQADIRPIKYENGEIIVENGKMFFTLSARMHREMYQAVVSWVPGTMEFALVGAIFYDCGDGAWCSDVAASIKFNRMTNRWNLWVCAFSHGHVLGCAEFAGDIRYGVNVVDIRLMERGAPDGDRTAFLGFAGDEDPDFIWDAASGKWYFTVCRLADMGDGTRKYAYHLFEGSDPFRCDRFVARSGKGAETGGSMVRVGETLHFVCGNDFTLRANYRVYDLPDLAHYTEMVFDYDDGGFRGWGTIVPLALGTRTRYFHLTFDRHNASDYNWSYGNLYCFEAL